MNPAIRESARRGDAVIRRAWVLALACASATLTPVGIVNAEPPQGAIVGWGEQVVGGDLSGGFVAVAAGGSQSFGLKADGSIVGWGCLAAVCDAPYGDCPCEVAADEVPGLNTGFVGLAAGSSHSLGLKGDGSIVAWGFNDYGETNVPAPNTDFIAIAAGGSHSLGLKAEGSIVAWGRNQYGQTNVPAPNTGFIDVAAGYWHSLALKSDGSIVAWGRDSEGQTNVPAPNAGFIAIAAGEYHSLGLRADGDSDTVVDVFDNCPTISNTLQDNLDGDAFGDACDGCPNSDLAETVVIAGCNSGVANHLFDDGCTMADRIAGCATGANNHGNFVSCVAQLTHDWVDEGVITPGDKGPIQRCAAQADVPQPHVNGRNLSKGESTAPTETLRRR